MNVRRLGHWAVDYLHLLHRHSYAFLYLKPPAHYLGFIKKGKAPVIILPGIYSKWQFLKAMADPLSLRGHPIYVLERLGYNSRDIPRSAKLVRELIEEKNLKNAVILAHSKGGLIGKYLLAFRNKDRRVKKLIAIASPFGGSRLADYSPFKTLRELSPRSPVVLKLQKRTGVNRRIVSIYGVFDNHVWPEASCRLPGARNIQVDAYGHHRILANRKVRKIIAGLI